MYALSLRRAPLVLARWGTLAARSGLRPSPGHLAAPSMSSLPRSLPQATLARLRSIHCYGFAWKNGEEGTSQSPRDPGEEETSQPPRDPAYGSLNIWSVLGIAVGATGVAVATGQYLLQRRVEDMKSNVKKATQCILNSKCKSLELDPYIDRKELMLRFKTQIMQQLAETGHGLMLTSIVCGPRGAGKTVLVNSAFEDVEAAVCIKYGGKTDNDFAVAVIEALTLRCPQGMQPIGFLYAVLNQARQTRIPTLIVEIDRTFDAEKLGNLLLLLKDLGDDKKLAKSVVVLSSSRAALSLTVNSVALRASYFCVGDLSLDESEQFLQKILKQFEGSTEQKKKLIDKTLRLVGNRILDLKVMAHSIPRTCTSLKVFEGIVEDYSMKQVVHTTRALEKFGEEFPKVVKDVHVLLKKLAKGESLYLAEVCHYLKCSQTNFINKNACIEPHVFYINPDTTEVYIASHYVKLAFQPSGFKH